MESLNNILENNDVDDPATDELATATAAPTNNNEDAIATENHIHMLPWLPTYPHDDLVRPVDWLEFFSGIHDNDDGGLR